MAETAPKYHRIKEALLAEIGRGGYVPGRAFVTEREVCRRFGVSRITASRALNDLVTEGVLVRKRGSGTFVAEGGGPPPEENGGGRRTVGCLLHGLEGRHVSEVLRGVESVCREAGYHLLLFDSRGEAETEAASLRRAVEAGVDGLVVFPVEGYENAAHFEELRWRGVPLVMVDRYYPALAFDVVVPDNFAVGYELTERLVERGHRHIAALWWETNCTSVLDRLTGHRQALRERGLPIVSELSTLRSYWQMEREERYELLRRWLEAPYRPSAFFCANGYVLALVATDLISLGVDLSAEVELAGMDDAGPYDLLSLASLTAVLPSHRMGSEAMRLLLDRMEGERPDRAARHVVLPVEFSVKDPVAISLPASAVTVEAPPTGDPGATNGAELDHDGGLGPRAGASRPETAGR
jgi:DNA-binding LacI/PurR family transcriptional regulator